jgi:putative Mg2+ transporter-C (MgtC) family protein
MAFALSPVDIDIGVKLIVAVVLGGIVGLEREFNKSAAGIKTYAIVCLGAALFTAVAATVSVAMAAGVITGIGFLGAAVVFKNENRVTGITTAALIWSIAAIGFAVGIGLYFAAVVSTILIIVILVPVEYVEKKLLKTHNEKGF